MKDFLITILSILFILFLYNFGILGGYSVLVNHTYHFMAYLSDTLGVSFFAALFYGIGAKIKKIYYKHQAHKNG